MFNHKAPYAVKRLRLRIGRALWTARAAESRRVSQSVKALINCKTCGREVSPNAATCPHCGEKLKTQQSAIGIIAAIIMAQ
jgi:rRNA maturation endonuclease Nob1